MGLGRVGSILGPMVGGWILGSSLAAYWNFYAFAVPAVLAAIIVILLPGATSAGVAEPVAEPKPANRDLVVEAG